MPSVRVAFHFRAVVHSCSNVPHDPHTRVFFKWKLVNGTSTSLASCSGVSVAREVSSSNVVAWDDDDSELKLSECELKLTPDTTVLQSRVLRLSIRQETRSRGGGAGYVRLGLVHIELAEYAGLAEVCAARKRQISFCYV